MWPSDPPTFIHEPPSPSSESGECHGQSYALIDLAPLPGCEDETQPRSRWIRHVGFIRDRRHQSTVLIVPSHFATGSIAGLKYAPPYELIHV
jgi:hypothetical protein